MAATFSAPSTGTIIAAAAAAAPTTSTNRVPATTGATDTTASSATTASGAQARATAAAYSATSTPATSTPATALSSADLKKYTWPDGPVSFTYPGTELYSPNSKKTLLWLGFVPSCYKK